MALPRKTHGCEHVPQYHYTAVFEPAADGGFIASIPAFAGLTIQGDTLKEARTIARQAIEQCLGVLIKTGEEIPIDSNTAHIERISVSI